MNNDSDACHYVGFFVSHVQGRVLAARSVTHRLLISVINNRCVSNTIVFE